MVTPNRLERQFNPLAPNKAWVTNNTNIRLALSWCGDGLVFTPHYWLVNKYSYYQKTCVKCFIDGGIAL